MNRLYCALLGVIFLSCLHLSTQTVRNNGVIEDQTIFITHQDVTGEIFFYEDNNKPKFLDKHSSPRITGGKQPLNSVPLEVLTNCFSALKGSKLNYSILLKSLEAC